MISTTLPARPTMLQLVAFLMPELEEICSRRTLREYRAFCRHWDRIVGDPPLAEVSREHLLQFRESLLSETWTDAHGREHPPVSNQTYLKHEGMFRKFCRIAAEQGIIDRIPSVYMTRKSGLPPAAIAQRVRPVRALITSDEMQRLYQGCSFARYPSKVPGTMAPLPASVRCYSWRAFLLVLWTYGLRVSDMGRLTWECIDPRRCPDTGAPGMLRFKPWKLRRRDRLQGLPLTDLLAGVFQWLPRHTGTELVFPWLTKPGCWNRPRSGGEPHWIEGWRVTLERDICAPQGIIPTMGPASFVDDVADRDDASQPLTPQHFRQTMVSQLNDYASATGRRLGRFVAGHTGGAVDAQSYDRPDEAVFQAISQRERDRLPECFQGLLSPALS